MGGFILLLHVIGWVFWPAWCRPHCCRSGLARYSNSDSGWPPTRHSKTLTTRPDTDVTSPTDTAATTRSPSAGPVDERGEDCTHSHVGMASTRPSSPASRTTWRSSTTASTARRSSPRSRLRRSSWSARSRPDCKEQRM